MLVQSVSVFSLAVFLWALLPEIKWMMMMIMTATVRYNTIIGYVMLLTYFVDIDEFRVYLSLLQTLCMRFN